MKRAGYARFGAGRSVGSGAAVVALAVACARPAAVRALAGAGAAAERVAGGTLAAGASAYNPSPAPDGRTLVFARSEPGFRHSRIFTTRVAGGRRGSGWTAAAPVPFTDPRWNDTDPTLSADGHTLYFASDRPAPGRDATRRDYDLWRVRRAPRGAGAAWGVPEHLGPAANTRNQEVGPTWRDGVLYFASARCAGVGGLDLYAAPEVHGRFGPAALFGGALNTVASEGDPEFSPDGRVLLFWSDRPGGRGSADLYASRRTADGTWAAPLPLRGAANSPWFDMTPAFSTDGRWLYFASERPSGPLPVRRPAPAPGEPRDGEGASDVWRVPVAAVLP